ncbi:GntR family transcriptional regulator [Mameliella sp.]|uniref:GntR family transcriptional regulator n=2 Tax=Mameliella sp. TaxID=1924940 RepID=UPI003BA8D65F
MKKRYPEVAARLMADLRAGAFRVGEALPSEAALCARFGASRSTIRSALTELARLGMIDRKQGAATRVISSEPPPTYVHSMTATGDLLQFAGASRREVLSVSRVVADDALAQRLGDRPGRRWCLIRQTRHVDGLEAPVGCTDVFLNETYADIADEVQDYSGLVYTLLEERHGVIIREIRQSIKARPVPESLADLLQVAPGSHALELRRQYLDGGAENQIATVSILPADRYSYEITLRRERM